MRGKNSYHWGNLIIMAVLMMGVVFYSQDILAQSDPDLDNGFPVRMSNACGGAKGVVVGNIDFDEQLEIVTTDCSEIAFNHDGTTVSGWPPPNAAGSRRSGYPALGKLSGDNTIIREIPSLSSFSFNKFRFLGSSIRPPTYKQVKSYSKLDVIFGFSSGLVAYNGSGTLLPGWPRRIANYIASPPSLVNTEGDELFEVFNEEQDGELHGYSSTASVLSGWPTNDRAFSQQRHTPAIGPLYTGETGEFDGETIIVTASGSTSAGVYVHAYYVDGQPVFPPVRVTTQYGFPFTFPVLGDVDRDGINEIVIVQQEISEGLQRKIIIIEATSGRIERQIPLRGSIHYGSTPALADLNRDGVPEIIVLSNNYLEVVNGQTGNGFPGFPVALGGNFWTSNTYGPVIGDIDGDGEQEIVFTLSDTGSAVHGELRAYNVDGSLVRNFPKRLPIGLAGYVAIADIDLDNRNEIIVRGEGVRLSPPTAVVDEILWVYDLGGSPHGNIEWGQFGGNAAHQGFYPVPKL